MNVTSILKTVGAGLLASTPLGSAALLAINSMLPDDKKLPATATGVQADQSLQTLTAAQRVEIELSEVRLEVEQERGRTERYKAMAASDGQETRARIVVMAIKALISISAVFILAVAWVYVTEGAEVAFSYEMTALYVAVTGTFAYVIRAYFGDLRAETQSRHRTIDDKPQPAATGLAALFGRGK